MKLVHWQFELLSREFVPLRGRCFSDDNTSSVLPVDLDVH